MRSKLIPPLLGYYTMVSSGRDDGIVESGLVVEYKFDEGSGTTVTDHISGYNMTLGATTAAPAWDSYGLDFDGSNDLISASVPDSVFLGANGFTVLMVANIDAWKATTMLISKFTATTNLPIDLRTESSIALPYMVLFRANTKGANKQKAFIDIGAWRMFGVAADQAIESNPDQYVNACKYYADITGGAGATGTATGTNADLKMGFITSRYLDGHVAYCLIYNRKLSLAEVEQNYTALRTILSARSITLPDFGVGLAFKGDSMTSGYGLTESMTDYPSQVMAALGSGYDKWNFGITGQSLSGMVEGAATEVDQCLSSVRSRHICILWGGSNDIDGGTAATTVYANLETYVAARKAAGFDDVIVLTALDRAQYDAAQRIQYAAYNTLIKDGAATGGYTVADVDGDARLQDYTDTTYFNADQVHLIAAGYAVVAGIVKTAIEAII